MSENVRLVSPGTLIKDYLHDNEVTQTQLAELTGYSEKQVSLILNDKSPVTKSFAEALETELPGTSSAFWLRYAGKFQAQESRETAELNGVDYKAWDRKYYLSKLFRKQPSIGKLDQIKLIKDATGVKNLEDDLPCRFVYGSNVAFLRNESKCGESNREYLDLWFSLVVYLDSLNLNREKQTFKGKEALASLLKEHKALWETANSEQLIANVAYFASQVGIHVIFCDSAPTTYVRGAAFPYEGEICLVLTNRFKSIEYVIFAFVHELMHIINGDVSLDKKDANLLDEGSIDEAATSGEAKNYFVSPGRYQALESLCDGNMPSPEGREMLFALAKEEKTTPGMLVTFLQHDKDISFASLRECLHPFEYSKDDLE
jgi:plasmid maintenance system antidote protein VapI